MMKKEEQHCIMLVKNNNLEGFRYLVEECHASIDANDGSTPLHYASKNGHLDFVRFLCEKGANVDAKANDGSTPLHYANEYRRCNVKRYLHQRMMK